MPSVVKIRNKAAFEELIQKRLVLIDLIRSYVRNQIEYWQRIPYLALKADGRTGFSGRYPYAYQNGLWMIHNDIAGDRARVYVDCATGELLDRFQTHSYQKPIPASDRLVAELVNRLMLLDASLIINDLERKAAGPIASYSSQTAKEIDSWRKEIREGLGLQRRYSEDQRGSIKRLSF